MLISTLLVKAGWGNTSMHGNPVLLREECFVACSALLVQGKEAENAQEVQPRHSDLAPA